MADALTSAVNRANALKRWDKEPDRYRATQPMRDGLQAKYRAQVLEEFPDLTDEAEIQNRIERKFKIQLETMWANSLKTRRAKATAKRRAALNALADAIAAAGPAADESARDSDEPGSDADSTAA